MYFCTFVSRILLDFSAIAEEPERKVLSLQRRRFAFTTTKAVLSIVKKTP